MKKRLPALLCVLALAFTLIGCGGGGGGGLKTYDVSGTVFLNGGNASPGDVRITFVDVDDATKVLFDAVQPDSASGAWSKDGLSETVRIKPVLDGYSFEPSSLVVSDTRDDVNFTGTVVTDTYTISGCVTDANGEGLSDVRITVTGSFETKTYDTDDNGLWSIGEVYGTVTVTPTMDGWIFEPENRELVVESDTGGLDFTGRQVYSIYGYVKDGNGMGLPGVTITATGEFEGERSAVSSGPDGYWRIDKVYGTVTVTPNDNTRFF